MNAQTCLSILQQIRDAAFATVDENNHPQVRIIDVMLIEEGKLYFCTARGKDFYHQLITNKTVAVTGMNEKYQMVRLHGNALKLPDQKKWIDRIFYDHPSMKDVYPNENRYILEAFCLEIEQIEFFDLGVSPIFRQTFSWTGQIHTPKGFIIDNTCIGCGKCAKTCPQACIHKGRPYQIRQENCLHCGLCAELCPTNSIRRRPKNAS